MDEMQEIVQASGAMSQIAARRASDALAERTEFADIDIAAAESELAALTRA